MKKPEYKLCYVDPPWAFFTANMDDTWGDDWNDAPYEHNAGDPYTGPEKPDNFKVAFYGGWWETPGDKAYCNSEYSVEDINKAQLTCLENPYCKIHAGTTYNDFVCLMHKYDSIVYEPIGVK